MSVQIRFGAHRKLCALPTVAKPKLGSASKDPMFGSFVSVGAEKSQSLALFQPSNAVQGKGNAKPKFGSASFTDPRIRASMRRALADEIDRLLNLIDALDDDPDLEAAGDDEPSLGWSVSMAHGTTADAEES